MLRCKVVAFVNATDLSHKIEYARRLCAEWKRRRTMFGSRSYPVHPLEAGLPYQGGVSDATVRSHLAGTAAAAGMKTPSELIQLPWNGHASLRTTWGNPTAIKSVLLALARKEGIAMVDGLEDPLVANDPWSQASTDPKTSRD
eukprot:343008-Amphidinium_carterae.1